MFKQASLLCTSLFVTHASILLGDAPGDLSDGDSAPIFTEQPIMNTHEETSQPSEPVVVKSKHITSLSPFTGKITRNKVRLRTGPDIDSTIVTELAKGELLVVVGEVDEFFTVEAPKDIKAYVFRSFILDGQIEGNRVNVRLKPDTESPVLTHLNTGDAVAGTICATNNKWLEIAAPSSVRLYVAKSFIDKVGGPEVKVAFDARKSQATKDLSDAELFAQEELQKEFASIDLDKVNLHFQSIIADYKEFPCIVERAQETLAKVHEQFLDKQIVYLDQKPQENTATIATSSPASYTQETSPTDKMREWSTLEEALYLSWLNLNDGRDMHEYYEEQKFAATKLTGIIEPYSSPVQCKPGDFFLKKDGLPIGYIYSTKINLQELVGKKVTCVGAPRPNNNFAFPAYFVLEIED